MALVRMLRIDSEGFQQEHDPSSDSIQLANLELDDGASGFTEIGIGGSDVDGPTVINDDSTNYTNFTPAGNTLRETLEAIDTALGDLETDNAADVVEYTNGEATPITVGQAVYISAADTVMLAENDIAAKDDPIGLVKAASIAAAASGEVYTNGLALGVLTGATAGNKYFLDSTAGVISTTVPALGSGQRVVFMGYAKNATDLQLRIQQIG